MGKGKLKAKIKSITKKDSSKPKKKILKKVGIGLLAASTGGVSLLATKKGKSVVKKVAKKAKSSKALKKVGIGALAIATGGVSLAGTKKGKAAIKKAAKKLKGSNPIKVLKKIAKKAGEAATFATLLPFLPPMLLALKQKGVKVSHPANVKEVSNLFYVNVIKKQHLESCEAMGNNGNVAYNHASKIYKNSPEGRENLIEEAASGIITAILNFFTAKKKQANAQNELAEGGEVSEENELTPEESELVDVNEPVTSEDKEVIEEFDNAHDELAQEVGGEDSDGNVNVPEEAVNDEIEESEGENLESLQRRSRNGIMKHFSY